VSKRLTELCPLPACAIGIAVLVLLPACGKRGAPLPPLRKNPQPVENLSVAQRADQVELSFAAPYRTLDGELLSLLDVEVLFAAADGEMDVVGEIRKLEALPGEAVSTTWPLPAPGALLRFSVRTLSRGKASPLSEEIRFIARERPLAPHEVAATVTPVGVRVFWTECVASLADPWVPPLAPSPQMQSLLDDLNALLRGKLSPDGGEAAKPANLSTAAASALEPGAPEPVTSPVPEAHPIPPSLGVMLYRRVGDADFEPLGATPLVDQGHTDPDVVPGERYCYVARTVLSGMPRVESFDSAESCVLYRDVATPNPPLGLSLLRLQDGTVRVSWSPSPETDLSHYNVYRGSISEALQPIAQAPADQTQYLDLAVPPGIVIYALSAEDVAGNESPQTSPARMRPE
jgi:hypothetical protein